MKKEQQGFTLIDEELADQVWDAGKIDDLTVWVAQWRVANSAILNS